MAAIVSISPAGRAAYAADKSRASDLLEIRTDLRRIARHGGFTAAELYDMVACLQACLPEHGNLLEAKKSLEDLCCDLDGLVNYYEQPGSPV